MKQWQGQYRKSLEEAFCCRCSKSSSDLILIFTVEVLLSYTQAKVNKWTDHAASLA